MRKFIGVINKLSQLCGLLSVLLIAVSILIVCQMVVLRYGFSASTSWQTDVVTFALVSATLLGCPYLLLTGGHVNVDIVINSLSTAHQKILKVFSLLIVMFIGVAFTITGGELTLDAFQGGWLSDTVAEIPLWMAYIAMPVGFALLALQALADIIELLFYDLNPS